MRKRGPVLRVPFVLASASPRRRRLLSGRIPGLTVIPSGVRERRPRPGEGAGRYAVSLAREKALAVARRLAEGLVLGADTVVSRAGRIYGKPSGRGDARGMLARLSGRWHWVHTGLALAARPSGQVWSVTRRTAVRLRRLSEADIARWSGRHLDKAGAYAAQAKGNPFIDAHRGDFDNVVGLPWRGVRDLLRRARRAGYAAEIKSPRSY